MYSNAANHIWTYHQCHIHVMFRRAFRKNRVCQLELSNWSVCFRGSWSLGFNKQRPLTFTELLVSWAVFSHCVLSWTLRLERLQISSSSFSLWFFYNNLHTYILRSSLMRSFQYNVDYVCVFFEHVALSPQFEWAFLIHFSFSSPVAEVYLEAGFSFVFIWKTLRSIEVNVVFKFGQTGFTCFGSFESKCLKIWLDIFLSEVFLVNHPPPRPRPHYFRVVI